MLSEDGVLRDPAMRDSDTHEAYCFEPTILGLSLEMLKTSRTCTQLIAVPWDCSGSRILLISSAQLDCVEIQPSVETIHTQNTRGGIPGLLARLS